VLCKYAILLKKNEEPVYFTAEASPFGGYTLCAWMKNDKNSHLFRELSGKAQAVSEAGERLHLNFGLSVKELADVVDAVEKLLK